MSVTNEMYQQNAATVEKRKIWMKNVSDKRPIIIINTWNIYYWIEQFKAQNWEVVLFPYTQEEEQEYVSYNSLAQGFL